MHYQIIQHYKFYLNKDLFINKKPGAGRRD